jgi:hypothetical protein
VSIPLFPFWREYRLSKTENGANEVKTGPTRTRIVESRGQQKMPLPPRSARGGGFALATKVPAACNAHATSRLLAARDKLNAEIFG